MNGLINYARYNKTLEEAKTILQGSPLMECGEDCDCAPCEKEKEEKAKEAQEMDDIKESSVMRGSEAMLENILSVLEKMDSLDEGKKWMQKASSKSKGKLLNKLGYSSKGKKNIAASKPSNAKTRKQAVLGRSAKNNK